MTAPLTARHGAPRSARRMSVMACLLAAVCAGASGADPSPRFDSLAPTAPLLPSASAVSPFAVIVAWFPPIPLGGSEHYIVYRDGVAVGTSTSTSFTDRSLQPSTTYRYRVSAVDGAGGESPLSSTATVTTMSGSVGGADGSPPTAPTGLQANAVSVSEIDIAWQAASDPESGIAHYRLYRDGGLVATTTATSFSDGAVEPQTTYGYRVSAVNVAGREGSLSGTATATTPAPPPPPPPPPAPPPPPPPPPPSGDTTPPTTPADLEARAVTPRQIDLEWADATDAESGIAVYNVFRDGVRVTSTAATVYSDAGREPETAYTYEVSAVNGAGLQSPRSAPVTATTPAEPDTTPPAPPGPPRIVGS